METLNLTKSIVAILGQVHAAMLNFNAPMLLDEKHWKVAAQMADSGLLQRHQPILKSFGYSLTELGASAYRSVMPEPVAKPLVKAWGNKVPATLKGKKAFIKSQAKPMGRAKYLEHTSGEGESSETTTFTLSEVALEAKLMQLGFKGWYDEESRERFNIGDEDSDIFYFCDETGELLNGCWSSDPDALIYFMSGFAWRREQGFQMEDKDWQEAYGYLERLKGDDSSTELLRFICDSCFIEPTCHNNTGLHNPGGPCGGDMEDLKSLFDFMRNEQESQSERPSGG